MLLSFSHINLSPVFDIELTKFKLYRTNEKNFLLIKKNVTLIPIMPGIILYDDTSF